MRETIHSYTPEPFRDMSPTSEFALQVFLYGAGEEDLSSESSKSEEITSSNTEPTPEKPRRVEVSGRVGRDPRVNETARGTLIAKFPLAEHPDGKEGETIWHTIVSFKDLAKKVSDTVHKGDQVKVIGYPQDREFRGRTHTEVNAVVVKPLRSANEPTKQE